MTKELREKLQKEHFFIRSRTEIVEGLAKEVWTLDEDALIAWHEQEMKEAERRTTDKLQKDFNDYAITNAKSEYAQSAIILVRNFLAISSLK